MKILTRSSIPACLLSCLIALGALFLLPSSAQAVQSVKILLVNSYHHGFTWTDDIISGVRSVLKKDDDLRIEYMDTRRISSKEHLANLYESFRIKFNGQSYDVIIVSDDPALELMLDLREELFPSTPVVFCGINDFTDAKLRGKLLYTGVVEDIDLKDTLDIALKLHPKARRVLAPVNSNATGIANRRLLEKTIPLFEGMVEFEIIQDPELAPFLNRLKHATPDDYLILLTGRFKSAHGVEVPIDMSTPQIAETGIPSYSLWEFYLGRGIIGGKLTNGFYQGKTAGEIARRILNGEQQIQIVRTSPNVYMFDFRELERFKIDGHLLPEGSVIINKPQSFYARNRMTIWAVLAIVLALSTIITYLSRIIVQKNKAQEELRRYQANLETQVEERTLKLSQSNARLQDEITERKLAEAALRESEEKHRVLFRDSPDAFLILVDGYFADCNHAAEVILRGDRTRIIGQSLQMISPEFQPDGRKSSESAEEKINEALRVGNNSFEWVHRRFDGSDFTVEVSIAAIMLDGKSALFTSWRDITERKQTENLIRARLELMQYSTSHSLADVLQKTLDQIGELTSSPIGFYHFVESDQKTLSLQAWSTRTLQEFCTAQGVGMHYPIDQAGVWADCAHSRQPVIHNDYANLPHRKGMPEGHAHVTRELVVPILRKDNVVAILGVGNKSDDYNVADVELVHYFADIAWEITERKRAETEIDHKNEELQKLNVTISLQNIELEQLSITDTLTGLYNRRKLDQVFIEEKKRAVRYGLTLSVIMADIDMFKSVNDLHGHQVGDIVLSTIAGIFGEGVRETDILGRWGGEEFMVICPYTDLGGAAALSEKLRQMVEANDFGVAGWKTCSFGVAQLAKEESIDAMVSRVDAALYRAKKRGRNRVEYDG